MAALRGERFHVDLPSDGDEERQCEASNARASTKTSTLVGDVLEKKSSIATAPVAPSLKTSSGGFPAHKKRMPVSRFKQQRSRKADANGSGQADGHRVDSNQATFERDAERVASIDAENERKLASMSEAEIEIERQELMRNLHPSLIDKLMRHADRKGKDVPTRKSDAGGLERQKDDSGKPPTVSSQPKAVSFDLPDENDSKRSCDLNGSYQLDHVHSSVERKRDFEAQEQRPENLDPLELQNGQELPDPPPIHFPQPCHPPPLDPRSPSFLSDLHSKYFPSLPSDPEKLAWMSSTQASDSPYLSSAKSVPVSAIRFSFDGTVIAPRTAQLIPVSAGLHHHGQAPESAGYTISELAYLARSAFPAQRCIAYQTLGRILYRLGKGEFGEADEGVTEGLWKCVDNERVLDTLQEEAGKTGRHLSAKAYATEALWLWSRGGGLLRKAT